ncbi:hypothetical protein [Streptomyces sp. NPDC096311]|uniref:hypothetical protein n=1 Tax=Streptomyces sp. NPDC096311 TaxID=3366083 RepID=UPI003813262A
MSPTPAQSPAPAENPKRPRLRGRRRVQVANFEQVAHGASSSQAYSTYTDSNGVTHYSPYVEYDIDYYNAPGSSRNSRRLIRNPNTGNAFVTYDHYQSFYYLGRF